MALMRAELSDDSLVDSWDNWKVLQLADLLDTMMVD